MINENSNIKLKNSSYLYMLIMLLFVFGGGILQKICPPSLSYGQKMTFVFLTELILVFLPTAIFIYFNKISFKDLRFNKISVKNLLISIGIMIFSMPIATFINFIWILFLKHFGKIHAPADFTSQNIVQLLINIFIVAVAPAVFEELLFRGVILRGYEKLGKYSAIICSAILFGLLHRDLQSLVGTTLLGIIIGFIVYKTNSIYPGMIAHFINNGFVVLLSYFVSKISPETMKQLANSSAQEAFNNTEQIILMVVFLGGIAAFFLGALIGLIILFNYTTKDIYNEVKSITIDKTQKSWLIPVIISIVAVGFAYYKQMM